MDESGFPFGTGDAIQVVSWKMTKTTHVQHDPNRKNVSIIITVCADGSHVAPTVIFKGANINSESFENNPLEAA